MIIKIKCTAIECLTLYILIFRSRFIKKLFGRIFTFLYLNLPIDMILYSNILSLNIKA